METYNYLENVIEDVKTAILDGYDYKNELKESREDFEQRLNDELWTNDSVTGNGSGSYTFNAYKAEEYLCHNFELLAEALREFGCAIDYIERGPEACDVTIRCYLLGQAISQVLDELEKEVDEDNE